MGRTEAPLHLHALSVVRCLQADLSVSKRMTAGLRTPAWQGAGKQIKQQSQHAHAN